MKLKLELYFRKNNLIKLFGVDWRGTLGDRNCMNVVVNGMEQKEV